MKGDDRRTMFLVIAGARDRWALREARVKLLAEAKAAGLKNLLWSLREDADGRLRVEVTGVAK